MLPSLHAVSADSAVAMSGALGAAATVFASLDSMYRSRESYLRAANNAGRLCRFVRNDDHARAARHEDDRDRDHRRHNKHQQQIAIGKYAGLLRDAHL